MQLTSVGINAASIGFSTLTLESDKFICVREQAGETSQVPSSAHSSVDLVFRLLLSCVCIRALTLYAGCHCRYDRSEQSHPPPHLCGFRHHEPRRKDHRPQGFANFIIFPSCLTASSAAAAKSLQIFNLETKTKVKACTVPEDVTYWRWISNSTIAIVTDTAVFHWSMEGLSFAFSILLLRRNQVY